MVKAAASGADAVALAHEEAPDVIVAEMMLPDGGPSLVRRLRADPATADAVLIVVTTQDATLLRDQAIEAGADSYLVKPCGALRLAEAMAIASRARFQGAMPSQLHHDAVMRAALRSLAIRERVVGGSLPHADPVLD